MAASGTACIVTSDAEGHRVLIGLDVLSWRYEELERAGYPVAECIELSAMPDVDLHVACDLLRNGATLKEALRILL